MAALTNTAENKLIDWLFRGQALGLTGASAAAGSGPTSLYVGLFTTAPTDSTAGVEIAGNAYARVAVASSLANWAGTQAVASTAVSSGTNGTTSNNLAITFPTPTPAGWGVAVAYGVFDAASGGNLLFYAALTVSKTLNVGDLVQFAAGTLTFQLDN